jgi:DNA repair exonuclease SbcCD nuclease subunit
MLAILHISDLHFGRRSEEIFRNKPDLAKSIVRAISPNTGAATSRVLVVSGDLVFRGSESVNAYLEARMFLQEVCRQWAIDTTQTIICPGNHDVVTTSQDPFDPINEVIFAMTRRSALLFKNRTSVCVSTPEADFLVMNSAFRCNHEYGSVDVDSLPAFPTPAKPRIAVLHHNLLGVLEKDSSAVRNAYPLLVRLLHDRVRLLLHGHQHIKEEFPIGDPRCRIVGAGSLNFKSDNGIPNQFNLVTLGANKTHVFHYLWRPDLSLDGSLGAWKATSD